MNPGATILNRDIQNLIGLFGHHFEFAILRGYLQARQERSANGTDQNEEIGRRHVYHGHQLRAATSGIANIFLNLYAGRRAPGPPRAPGARHAYLEAPAARGGVAP